MSTEHPTLFEGKYEVIGKIAEGGMGAVYKVRHVLLNEVRVIKVMRPQAAEQEEHRKRFLREAQMATKLRHPSIVTFYDFAIDETGTSYMVMEFIDGVSFNQLIRALGPVPPPLAIVLAKQCLSALSYLHRRNIVHRDVAPDNMMLAKDDEAGGQSKLIDLGIAKAVQEESLTVGDAFLGKLRYCSPEQLNMGTPLDGRSDLFSFGIVFSEMLTGVCPLPGNSAQSILMAHVSGKFLPFDSTDPQGRVPHSLRAVVDNALQVEREDRIASADDFIRLLDDAARREGMQATPEQLRVLAERAIAKRPASPFKPPTGAGSPLDAILLPSTVKTSGPTAPQRQVEKTERWEATPTPQPVVLPSPATEKTARRRFSPWLLTLLIPLGLAAYVLLRTSAPVPSGGVAVPSPDRGAPTPALQPTVQPAVQLKPTMPEAPTAVAVLPPPSPEPVTFQPTVPAAPPRLRATSAPPAKPHVLVADGAVHRRSAPNAAPTRYCATTEKTSYAQAAASEKSSKFDSGGAAIFRGPRPDYARIEIRIEVSPAQPVEGEPFHVTARLVNGGDLGITVAKVEESAAASRGGFQGVSDMSLPVTAQVGASVTLYSSDVTLGEGDAYAKEIRITDKVGDTWRASVRVGACPE